MTSRRRSKKWIASVGVTVVVAASIPVAFVIGADASGPATRSQQAAASFPRNLHGLTYGSGLDAISPKNEPDLMQAFATNGKLGYVMRVDLESQPLPSSPAQALAIQRARTGAGKFVPVYNVDGTTQIGVFDINGTGQTLTSP